MAYPVRYSFVVERTSTQEWEEHRSERLYDAAARGQVASVDKLLGEGANPDWISPKDGLTPLLTATLNGRAECVLSLLRAGADIYATGAQGCTALDLFVKLKTMFRLCEKFIRSRNYKDCYAYLMKADDDCRRRSLGEVSNYQGVVVVHPGSEMGLVCLPRSC